MAMTDADLVGRSFLVTGANSGIGRALVEALAARGATVVLAARSSERIQPVLRSLKTRYPGTDPSFLFLDLADLTSVRKAAADFLAGNRRLDVLVNNAGVAGTYAVTADGFDLTYQTNHIGPFLFTNLLLPRLLESPAARIVNVSSVAQQKIRQLDWSGLERRTVPRRSGFPEYAMTKLMNVLHARELARRLATTDVTTSALHPGVVASNIWRALPRPLQWIMKRFMQSNEEGAQTSLYCATAPEVASQSGLYYDRCRAVPPNPLALDPALAAELWARTGRAVGIAE
jgi:dehydrogenase/reductase SDR family protein 13